ncbi:hypothetical protein EVAR_9522_1 [Eumeta japonica]|uniref:THAP-type domain-containing protein n=1 Tax=Eumeta variegata TaxID=151549 RepID=A0A4C1U3R9_EUMVA|nr:hypothetical protein EVAR_9522_1 [Eumeta japonica]
MPQVIKGSVRKLLHDMITNYKLVKAEAEELYNKKARCLDAIIEATIRLNADIQHNITASVENLRTLEQNNVYNNETQYLERIALMTGLSVRSLRRIKREGILNKGEWKTPGKTRTRKLSVSNLNEHEISMIKKKIDEFYTVKKEVPTLRKLLAELKKSMGFTGCRETLRQILLTNGLTIQSCPAERESVQHESTKKCSKCSKTEDRHVSELLYTNGLSEEEILNMDPGFHPDTDIDDGDSEESNGDFKEESESNEDDSNIDVVLPVPNTSHLQPKELMEGVAPLPQLFNCKQWLKVVGNEELVYLPIEKLNKIRFVCGNHFSKEDFNKKGNRLKKHAVPKINLSRPPLTDVQLLDFPQHLFSRNVSIQEEIPSTSQERQPTLSQSYTTVSIQEEIPSTSQERQPTLSESYTTVFVQEEMPGTIQERYPIPIKAYATVSIQEEMPGTSEERQPTLSESYTTVFAQEEMAGTSPERQPIPSESYATENPTEPDLDQHVLSKTTESETVQITDVHSEVPVLTIPEEFDIVETDFTEIDKQPLVYISGYIASTVVKSLNCVVCEQALQENNPESNPIYSYITLREWWKDQHALTYPSIKLCGLIQDALDILKRSN